MMKYGIAIFPSEEIQREANAYRKRYDPGYTLIDPHITLKARFEIEASRKQDMIDELKKIARETKPFDIKITKVSSFAPVTNTIYFKVEPVEELMKLHELVHSGIFPPNQKYNFVPHITIAQDLLDGEYADIYGSLKMKEVYFEDKVDRFHLCYEKDDGTWEVYETFIFGEK